MGLATVWHDWTQWTLDRWQD